MDFITLIENNDNEGETWRFYLQLTGNEIAIDNLKDLITGDEWVAESFEFGEVIPESEVNVLVKHTNSGYMDYENKVVGRLEYEQPQDSEQLTDMLYKGGIVKYFKANNE